VPDRPRCKPAVQTANFVAALGTQPVIHRNRTDLSVPLAGPAIRQNGESEAIGAAGHCDGEKRSGLEESERGEHGAKLGEGERLCRWPRGQQPSFFFSSFARSLIAFPGLGKS
jgi:hypothetical protein